MCILAFFIYAGLAIYEFVPLYKEKRWGDFAANAVLWTISLTIVMLLCFNVDLPSPQIPIQKLISSILGKQA